MLKKILVVDDDPDTTSFIERHLVRAGYNVTTASDGITALGKVQEERPHLIILNDEMPNKSGQDVLKRLLEDQATAEIPVFVILDNGSDAQYFKYMQCDATAVLAKPVNDKELVELTHRILGDRSWQDISGISNLRWR